MKGSGEKRVPEVSIRGGTRPKSYGKERGRGEHGGGNEQSRGKSSPTREL